MTRPIARAAPLFFVATTALLVWPLYPLLGNRVEPRVFGLPWSLTYVLLVIALNSVVVAGLYLARVIDSDEAADDDGAGAGRG